MRGKNLNAERKKKISPLILGLQCEKGRSLISRQGGGGGGGEGGRKGSGTRGTAGMIFLR